MKRHRAFIALATYALNGCVSDAGIAPSTPTLELRPAEIDSTFEAWPEDQWWHAYAEPSLDRLIEHALTDHPSVQLAAARLAQASAGEHYLQANRGLRVDGAYNGEWQRFTESGLYPVDVGGSHDLDSKLGVDATLDLDLFGRNRALVESFSALREAGTAGVVAARLAISSTIATSYFELAHALALQQVARDTLRQRNRIRELVATRVTLGLDSNVELRQAEGAVHLIEGDLAILDETISLFRARMARLAVLPFAEVAQLAPKLKPVQAAVPSFAIPSDLLARRPDIVAARLRVESTLKGIESVKAEFYPSVNLGAFIGLSSLGLNNLFDIGSRVYGVRPALRLPIFDAGRLRAKLSFASASTDAAVAEYNDTLLNALRDVVRSLVALRGMDARVQAQRATQAAAENAYALALQRYQAGLTNYLTVLTTESEVLAQKRAAVDLAARAVALDISFKQALGGGYIRPESLTAN